MEQNLDDGDEDDDSDEDCSDDDIDEEEVKEELEDLKDSQNVQEEMKDNEEVEDDDEEVYGGGKVKKRSLEDEEDEDEAEIIGADEDLEDLKVGVKRPRENDKLVDKRKLKRQKMKKFRTYYAGEFFYKNASQLMY